MPEGIAICGGGTGRSGPGCEVPRVGQFWVKTRRCCPPVQNPDAGNDRHYSRKAPGRVVGIGRRRVL